MRKLGRTSLYTRSRSLDDRVSSLERRYDPQPLCCGLPHVKCTGSDFTATDGAYYGLAQLVGADPSAFGVADDIVVWNDLGDGSGYFYIKTDGGSSPGVVQTYTGPIDQGFGNNTLLMGYEAGVRFDGPLTTGTAQLYLGQGVGGSAVSEHRSYAEPNMMGYLEPVLRLSGEFASTYTAFDPNTVNISPKWSPILLVEGADWDVLETWFDWTVLSLLDDADAVFFP